MAEIDLIPNDYRHKQKAKKIIFYATICFVILLVVVCTGKFYLNYESSKIRKQVSLLQQQQEQLEKEEKLIQDLKNKRDVVRGQLAFVEMLDKGEGVGNIFLLFDKTLDKTVWLENWKYTGGDLLAEDVTESLGMKVLIKGQAIDHGALGKFVDRLLMQEEVREVKVIDSTMLNKEDETISFNMEII